MRGFYIFEEGINNRELEKIVRVILISGILILIPFIFYTSSRHNTPHMIFTVLNNDKQMGDYPHNAYADSNISLYFLVENHNYGEIDVKIRHLKGNSTVSVNSSGSYNATLQTEYFKTIKESEKWMGDGPVNTSFSEIGNDCRILFELWIKEDASSDYKYHDITYIYIDIV